MSGRDVELWKPVFSLASYFDELDVMREIIGRGGGVGREDGDGRGEKKWSTLSETLHKWAVTVIDERDIDLAIDEIRDRMMRIITVQCQGGEWVSFKQIEEWCRTAIEECPDWVKSKWIGATLKKFGFHKKRLVHGLTQVLIDYANLEKIKKRYVEALPTLEEEGIKPNILPPSPSLFPQPTLPAQPQSEVTEAKSEVNQTDQNVHKLTHSYSTRQLIIEFLEATSQKEPVSFIEIRTHVELLSGPGKEREIEETLKILAKEGIAFQPKVDGWVMLK